MLKSIAPRASPVLSRSGIARWFSPQIEAKTTSELSIHLKRKSLKPKPNKHKGIEGQPVHNIPPKHTESLFCAYYTSTHQLLMLFHLPGPLHLLISELSFSSLTHLLSEKPSLTHVI